MAGLPSLSSPSLWARVIAAGWGGGPEGVVRIWRTCMAGAGAEAVGRVRSRVVQKLHCSAHPSSCLESVCLPWGGDPMPQSWKVVSVRPSLHSPLPHCCSRASDKGSDSQAPLIDRPAPAVVWMGAKKRRHHFVQRIRINGLQALVSHRHNNTAGRSWWTSEAPATRPIREQGVPDPCDSPSKGLSIYISVRHSDFIPRWRTRTCLAHHADDPRSAGTPDRHATGIASGLLRVWDTAGTNPPTRQEHVPLPRSCRSSDASW